MYSNVEDKSTLNAPHTFLHIKRGMAAFDRTRRGSKEDGGSNPLIVRHISLAKSNVEIRIRGGVGDGFIMGFRRNAQRSDKSFTNLMF